MYTEGQVIHLIKENEPIIYLDGGHLNKDSFGKKKGDWVFLCFKGDKLDVFENLLETTHYILQGTEEIYATGYYEDFSDDHFKRLISFAKERLLSGEIKPSPPRKIKEE